MGGVFSDFWAAGRGRVVGDHFQILQLQEEGRGLWVSLFRFCGCGTVGVMGGVFSDFVAAGRRGADRCWRLGFVCFLLL